MGATSASSCSGLSFSAASAAPPEAGGGAEAGAWVSARPGSGAAGSNASDSDAVRDVIETSSSGLRGNRRLRGGRRGRDERRRLAGGRGRRRGLHVLLLPPAAEGLVE